MHTLGYIIVLILLIVCSAFFSGSETILISLYRTGGRHLKEPKLKKLLAAPDRLLSTMLLGNNLVNVAASAIATHLAILRFGSYGMAIATGVMTFAILTFGEILPKSIGLRNADKFALKVVKPVWYISIVFYPICKLLIMFAGLFTKGKANLQPQVTEEEIKAVVDLGEESGAIEPEEKEMIHKVFKLGDTLVKEIMVPKALIVSIKVDVKFRDAFDLATSSGYSRIPVYERGTKKVVGILYTKDLLNKVNGGIQEGEVREIMRRPYFVPESTRLDDLLQEFQEKRIQIAVVTKDDDKVTGIVTLEDVIEEMVGEIYDESDIVKKKIETSDGLLK
ncbi:MAG TPA: HlyC/CorC family transporter [Thermoplasmata archaeon]|nr:HlyC/CorC family transporter [Thermoplasmata archaeon]